MAQSGVEPRLPDSYSFTERSPVYDTATLQYIWDNVYIKITGNVKSLQASGVSIRNRGANLFMKK